MQPFAEFQENDLGLQHQCIIIARLQPGQQTVHFRVGTLMFLGLSGHGCSSCPRGDPALATGKSRVTTVQEHCPAGWPGWENSCGNVVRPCRVLSFCPLKEKPRTGSVRRLLESSGLSVAYLTPGRLKRSWAA